MATENMVKAGKGGLTFASNWDSTIEYDRLTGVRYDNKLFFSKKPIPIGLIPEDGEYWFLAYEGLTDEQWEALLNGAQQVGDSAKLGGKEAELYALLTDLANYLPLSGGEIKSNTNNTPFTVNCPPVSQVFMGFSGNGGSLGLLGFVGADNPSFRSTDGKYLSLLHTGNKPSGSYTGNGDATERTINVGGIGNALLVYGGGKGAIVYPDGAIVSNGTTVETLPDTQCKFRDGVYTLATTHPALNHDGAERRYQVL